MVLASALPSVAWAEMLEGVGLRVLDGDTVLLQKADGQSLSIRLAGIDAPEKAQATGLESKKRLTELCMGQQMVAEVRTRDKYGRNVARVQCNELDVARLLLIEGLAWHFRRYANTQPPEEADEDARSELSAREKKIGMWALPHPQSPWDWRAQQRKQP